LTNVSFSNRDVETIKNAIAKHNQITKGKLAITFGNMKSGPREPTDLDLDAINAILDEPRREIRTTSVSQEPASNRQSSSRTQPILLPQEEKKAEEKNSIPSSSARFFQQPIEHKSSISSGPALTEAQLLAGSEVKGFNSGRFLKNQAKTSFACATLILQNNVLRERLLNAGELYVPKFLSEIAASHPQSAQLIFQTPALLERLLSGTSIRNVTYLSTIARSHPDSAQTIIGTNSLRQILLSETSSVTQDALSRIARSHPRSAQLILSNSHLREVFFSDLNQDMRLYYLNAIKNAAPNQVSQEVQTLCNDLITQISSASPATRPSSSR